MAPLEEAGGLPDAEREAVWLDSGVREAVVLQGVKVTPAELERAAAALKRASK